MNVVYALVSLLGSADMLMREMTEEQLAEARDKLVVLGHSEVAESFVRRTPQTPLPPREEFDKLLEER